MENCIYIYWMYYLFLLYNTVFHYLYLQIGEIVKPTNSSLPLLPDLRNNPQEKH